MQPTLSIKTVAVQADDATVSCEQMEAMLTGLRYLPNLD
jgi:hypothetical protein